MLAQTLAAVSSQMYPNCDQIAQQQAAKDQAQQGWSAVEIARGISEVEITPTPDDLYHQAQEAAQRTSNDGLTLEERLRKELPLVAFPGVDLSAGHGFKSHELAGKGITFVPREEANLTGYVKGTKVSMMCFCIRIGAQFVAGLCACSETAAAS